jgi:hypothetical protein
MLTIAHQGNAHAGPGEPQPPHTSHAKGNRDSAGENRHHKGTGCPTGRTTSPDGAPHPTANPNPRLAIAQATPSPRPGGRVPNELGPRHAHGHAMHAALVCPAKLIAEGDTPAVPRGHTDGTPPSPPHTQPLQWVPTPARQATWGAVPAAAPHVTFVRQTLLYCVQGRTTASRWRFGCAGGLCGRAGRQEHCDAALTISRWGALLHFRQ